MNKVTYFEIPADDMEQAENFYSKAFGWEINKLGDGYTRIISCATTNNGVSSSEAGAINGGIQKRGDRAKAPTVVITADNFDETAAKIESLGGKIVIPKDDMGGMGWYGQFDDPAGNRIGLFQAN